MAIGLELQACVKHPAVACSGFGVLVIVVFALGKQVKQTLSSRSIRGIDHN